MDDCQVLVGGKRALPPIPSCKTMEVPMRHPDDFKGWADNHGALSDAIDRGLKRLMNGFRVLVRREYDAPWKQRRVNCD
jgi:hypothetical protein